MNKREWQTSTVVFMGLIIIALSISLFLSMLSSLRASPSIVCKDYYYDVYTRKICQIPEEDLIK